MVGQGALDQLARGESLYRVVRLDAVTVGASGLQLQLLEEGKVLVDRFSTFPSGWESLLLGKQELPLVLVDRLASLLGGGLQGCE